MGALVAAGEVLSLTLKYWKLVALAALIAAVPIAYLVGHGRGDSSGYSRRVAEVAAADLKAELERKGDNAKLAGMSDYDLCVSGLRGSGMPVDACEQLRGLPESKP
ncbi:hypothetical protein EFV37_25000 [Mesorhizobium loti]|uniref:Uncharacterized protein n=1 Tax=Mesorhizobium jarvisii TaxID=1777867 RepID=A0A6M7TJV3_9HYPH|nr:MULTISPECIES: hypothetical protein [Mesorhizobium]OBQ68419.1 hypothetical protein A9K72_09215 [Mesorhizobium loti]QKC65159.1 hypothetical protein EB229_24995 [Mesorhizobium jarvisii]QKD11074.1 hypothetical protein EFV37_25000 [Mesorhizobium loti]RJT31119.1 hypothetical protein D3242_22940 [Mesorhizobium jarvisii]